MRRRKDHQRKTNCFAIMYESFRTRDRLDMIVTLEYMIKLQYQGDSKMNMFKQSWLEVTNRMQPNDVPSDTVLRDTLCSNFKGSQVLKLELNVHYEMLSYDDPTRSYKTLLQLMDRCIMPQREQKNLAQTQIGLRLMVEGKDQMTVPAKTKGSGKDTATPAPKKGNRPTKGNGKVEDEAPVLPQSKAKAHAIAKLGEGNGKKQRERSESADNQPDRSKKHPLQILLFMNVTMVANVPTVIQEDSRTWP